MKTRTNLRRTLCLTLATALILALATLFSGCSANSPAAQVNKDLKEIQNSKISSTVLNFDDADFSDETKAGYEEFLARLSDFDFEIQNEEISEDGKTATVTVLISTYDFGTAFLDVWDEVATSNTKPGVDDFYKLLFDKVKTLEDKYRIVAVTFNCTKTDGGWTTDAKTNGDFRSAMFGGMIEIVKELAGQ